MQIQVRGRAVYVEDATITATAITKFAHNAEHEEFAGAVYGKATSGYTLEKYEKMQDNLGAFIGELDTAHLEAFVIAALDRLALKG